MFSRHAVTGVLAALLSLAPAQAGSLSGTASLREPIALPADAEFEAVLIDIALADAPARVLGRMRLKPAGQSPFRFTIAYRQADLTPHGRYAVRASVRQGQRLLFTTDTITPVLQGGPSRPLNLQLVPVITVEPAAASQGLGRLPASWRSDQRAGRGASRWQLDLSGDGSYQLRQTSLDRPAPHSIDTIGRWRLEAAGNRLVLQGGREGPLVFQPLDAGRVLRRLELPNAPREPGQPDHWQRLPTSDPVEPRLPLQGLFRYMADAPTIRLCATGTELPVAMEADYQRLERAYRRALPLGAAGQPMLVNLEALISQRPSAEPGLAPQRSLVVECFLAVHPGQSCPEPDGTGLHGSVLQAPPTPRSSRKQLQALRVLVGDTPRLP